MLLMLLLLLLRLHLLLLLQAHLLLLPLLHHQLLLLLLRHGLTGGSLARSPHALLLGARPGSSGSHSSPGRDPRQRNPLLLLLLVLARGGAVDSSQEEVVQREVLRAEQPGHLLVQLGFRRLLHQERGEEIPILLLVRSRELRRDRDGGRVSASSPRWGALSEGRGPGKQRDGSMGPATMGAGRWVRIAYLEQPALHLDQLLPSLARTAAARPAGRTLHGAQTV